MAVYADYTTRQFIAVVVRWIQTPGANFEDSAQRKVIVVVSLDGCKYINYGGDTTDIIPII